MRRNDRRAAAEAKRTIPDFTDLTAADLELAAGFSGPAQDWHAANDKRALELQIAQQRRDGTTRGLY